MPNDIQHERNRFNTMTPGRLATRLSKITHPQKLRNFVQMAREFGYSNLEEAAIIRYNTLRGSGRGAIPPPPGRPYGDLTASIPARLTTETIIPVTPVTSVNEKVSILLLDGWKSVV